MTRRLADIAPASTHGVAMSVVETLDARELRSGKAPPSAGSITS